MRIVNDTPFRFAPVAGRMSFPGHTCTLVVKGTFDLVPDGVATAAKEQPFPTGDEPYADDEEAKGSVRYANDFAPFKPRADVLCVGSFHAPGGTPVLQGRVGFSVGPMSRTLLVHGDRHWSGTLSLKASAALKIAKMEIRYENAYGGVGHGPNPVGRGYRKEDAEAGGKQRALANLEEMDDPARSARRKISPASFGPIAMTWEPRSKKLGTYKKKWLETRWPWFAEDIDWTYFNAAPESQQLLGYLRGDEEVVLENMHPEHPSLRTRLPATRVRCFLDEDGVPDKLREVEMRLDTLWVDADAGKLVLVWRGVADVADMGHKEVRNVFVHAEPLTEPEHGDAHYLARFHAAIAATEAQFEAPSETDAEEPQAEAVAPEPATPDETDLLIAEGRKKAEAELESLASGQRLPDPTPESLALLREHYAAQGIDAEHLFKQAEDEAPAEEVIAAPPQPERWTRERVIENLNKSGALSGADLSELDLAGLNLADVDLVDANLQSANLSGSDLTDADLSGANLSHANLRGATLRGTELSGATLDDADLSEARCEAAVFENASLAGATMQRLAASHAHFGGSSLTNADLANSDLTSANISGADLTEADCRDAVLVNAEAGGAKFVRANLIGADLTCLRASGADFSEARAGAVHARGAILEDAVLDRADFKFADLTGAMLMRAHAEETDFSAATLKCARFACAYLRAALFVRADLYEAILEQADLTDADATGANMYCAEFLDAVTDGLRISGAYLAGTKLDS